MRKILSLLAMMALAGCGGGGGANSAPNPNPQPVQTLAPQGNLVTPVFTIIIPPKGSTSGQRKPNFVSTATKSVTIVLNSVNGNPPTVTPTTVSTDLDNSGGACNTGCTVSGPPSPPGVPDNYTITTYDATGGVGGGGNALDTNSVTFTPTVGTANSVSVTLNGIPFKVIISALSSQTVDTAGQTQSVTVTVQDHSLQTITGTYANFVTITDPDPATYGASIKGTSLSGTHNGACVTSCVVMQTSTDTATLTYNGLAEDPVTLTSTTTGVTGGNAGTATFTPTLHAITHTSGGNSLAGGPGVDLYTTDNTSPVGYSGTQGYHEDGYTDAPYNKVLTTILGTSCAAFASIGAANASNDTVFTATATSNTAGSCTRVVSDGLAAANHGSGGPSFVVTYTTGSVSASSKHRKQ